MQRDTSDFLAVALERSNNLLFRVVVDNGMLVCAAGDNDVAVGGMDIQCSDAFGTGAVQAAV